RTDDPKRAREPALVLAAVGIVAEVVRVEGLVWVVVATEEAARARRELRAYVDENRGAGSATAPFEPVGTGLSVGLAWVLSLVAARAAVLFDAGDLDWHGLGRTDAARMIDGGEWWRAVTALFLHADAVHLASNLAFGAIFAVFLAHLAGSGATALLLLSSGALGNAVNAWARYPEHYSVGASTAVFGAVGAFVTFEFLRRQRDEREAVRRWAPLVIGVLLLGWFGTGDARTDVTAHLFGFLAGGLWAWVGARVAGRRDVFAARSFQSACWAITALAVVGSWATAVWL
ncbi:MAG: rhomboid family intramembrane serine protease, partial [Planctomycetota bacterium]